MSLREHDEGTRPLAAFLAVSFGGSIALSLAVAYGASPTALAPVAMLVPGLAVLFVRVVFGARIPDGGWRRFPYRWLPVALLVLPIAVHTIALPGMLLLEGRLPWAAWLVAGDDGLIRSPSEWGWGLLTPAGLARRVAINAAAGLLIVTAFAFFEEIGWRAWMLPRLSLLFGERNGVLVSAAIWTAWHVPYALSGLQRVENVAPVMLALVQCLGHLGAGMFLAWLFVRTRSIWIVSLAHGALNNWGQYAFKFMRSSGEHDAVLLSLVSAALLVVGVVVVTTLSKRTVAPARLG